MLNKIASTARRLVEEVRQRRLDKGGLDAFLYEYDLASTEGIALMCLAEALLRIPDTKTIDHLVRDKLATADWAAHAGQSDSFFVNAATWGLLITGKVLAPQREDVSVFRHSLKRFVERSSGPVIRKSIQQAMKVLGRQFVMGETIEEALKRARDGEKQGYRYSYDMLGEAARTAKDAERYFKSYLKAIVAIGKAAKGKGIIAGPGISVKLSALHPRYEFAKHDAVVAAVVPKLRELALGAKAVNIGLTVDAEEADRLDLSLDIIEAVFSDPLLNGWEGFGLAVQSYQKRAMAVLDWLIDLSRKHKRRFMVRLIKGAYWDAEIKNAQVKGLSEYPVFTRKPSTDVSFLACAKKILAAPDAFYPQFATHNAYSLAAVLEMADGRRDFEFQCLHGMGYTLYDQVVGPKHLNIPCRVYAPVGGHEDLLAYLVRRLLENGANTSFVNRIIDADTPIDQLIVDPFTKVRQWASKRHPSIPLPTNLYGAKRKNAKGIDLSDMLELQALNTGMDAACQQIWRAGPIINGVESHQCPRTLLNPANKQQVVGEVSEATLEQLEEALLSANKAFEDWAKQPVAKRAACLERAADLLEARMPMLMAITILEAGKTLVDAVAEVREAIDFCRYYAEQARQYLSQPVDLPGPTGETNQLSLHGRGVIACISPWNFPLAIFTGQITAALVTGNTVIAKPAEQTPLIASAMVHILHEAGIPPAVLQFLPGKGETIGARLVADERIKGVVFTGSTETARAINQTLANRTGAIVPLIAETGGQNAMIVDSSALPEQVVMDAVNSAFGSAGQRCSALRVLFVQEEMAPKLLEMLAGAMAELSVGNPTALTTDIGPVIDDEAQKVLLNHIERMQKEAKLIYQLPLSHATAAGTFVPPAAFEINDLSQLPREVFGPILHVIRYEVEGLDKVISAINNTGYGLTLGIQSRIDARVAYIQKRVRVGNTYVNRNVIGAVVGVQPFGGEGLSGTGPKAGGPHYLMRFCTERSLCINTTAAGGNASLLCIGE
jgi:RHH-type proline utilization regulon transcriptional repressor/proline dehydrogenase/delta 1-pyrroline-5-carboxylate dehydrogenase